MTRGPSGGSDSPIETYLDELVAEMSTARPRELRNLLAETEAHLRDATEAGVAEGMSARDAETRAVARFGPAHSLARVERDRMLTPLGVVLRQTVVSAWLLGAVGALAVGAAGLVAAVIALVGGDRVLVDVAPGRVLAASDCARWLAANPGARTCRDAAISDWAAETINYRIALGLIGGLALLGYVWFTRRRAVRLLPPVVVDTVALTLFATAGLWMLGLGLDAVAVASGRGSGQWLSAAPVAIAAAVAFGRRLWHDLRTAPA